MNKTILASALVAAMLCLPPAQAVAADSAFIENMPELTQDPDRPDAKTWVKPGIDRSAYSRVMIEPITIFISPDSKYKGLNADELKSLADRFHVTMTKTLEPEIAVMNQAGPGVLYLRAAITDVKLANKKRGLLGYTPIGFVVTAAADAAGARVQLKSADIEMEALDAVSGERLGVVVDKMAAKGDDHLTWEAIDEAFMFFAERFKNRMQEAN